MSIVKTFRRKSFTTKGITWDGNNTGQVLEFAKQHSCSAKLCKNGKGDPCDYIEITCGDVTFWLVLGHTLISLGKDKIESFSKSKIESFFMDGVE